MLRRRLLTKNDDDILWLYKDGDECVDVTGGWVKTHLFNGSSGLFNKNANDIYVQAANNTNGGVCGCCTNNPISLQKYNFIVISLKKLQKRNADALCGFITLLYRTTQTNRYTIVGKSGYYENRTVNGANVAYFYANGTQPLDELLYIPISDDFKSFNDFFSLVGASANGGVGFSKLGLAK